MSQSKLILAHLKTGATLNPLQALAKFGCYRLGARIYDLRQAGYNITTERREAPNGAIFAVYRLAK